jgi:hypothetical protein
MIVGVLVMLALGGCSAAPARVQSSRPYPMRLPRGEVLDVQVLRDGTEIRTTNTSVRSFGPSTMWLNMRFSRPIAGWSPGEELVLDLREFRDEFGERFRAGGFFARELPEPVVLAQIEAQGANGTELVGLIAITPTQD